MIFFFSEAYHVIEKMYFCTNIWSYKKYCCYDKKCIVFGFDDCFGRWVGTGVY